MGSRLYGRTAYPIGFAVTSALAAALVIPSVGGWSDPADGATRLTADVAVACWFTGAALLLMGRRPEARAWWVFGCAAYLIHVAIAFHRVHQWSHGAAFEHVEDVSGFGPGLFVSYGFSLLWAADAIWWWANPRTYDARPAWLDRAVHGFMAFIVFNGTVVYETGFIRYAGIAGFGALAVLALRRLRGESGSRRGPS